MPKKTQNSVRYFRTRHVGLHDIGLRVFDIPGDYAEQNFVLEVINVNDPPVITSQPNQDGISGSLYTYLLMATDVDDPLSSLRYQIDVAPLGMIIGELSGEIEWTPTEDQLGYFPVTVRVTDPEGAYDQQSFNIHVIAPEVVTPPDMINSQLVTKVGKTELFQATGQADSWGHPTEIRFDWGNGQISSWGEATAEYAWDAEGNYPIRAQARSSVNPEVVSQWSDALVLMAVSWINISSSVSPDNGGLVSIVPSADHYFYGQEVTIYAVPYDGYTFLNWSGSYTDSINPRNEILIEDLSLVANIGCGVLHVTPDTLSFSITQYEGSQSVNFAVHNIGNGPLNIEGASFSLGQFSIDNIPLTLQADQSATLSLLFSPIGDPIQNEPSIMTLHSNSPLNPNLIIHLLSEYLPPLVSASPAAIDFGSVPLGSVGNSTVLIQNQGLSDLIISSVSFANPSSFATDVTFPRTLIAGAELLLPIEFSPTFPMSYESHLTINTNSTSPQIYLSGIGEAALITTSLTSINFPSTLFQTVAAQELILNNIGNLPAIISDLTFSGVSGSAYSTTSPPISILPGVSLTLPITFSPSIPGDYNSELSILSNGNNVNLPIFANAISQPPYVVNPIPPLTLDEDFSDYLLGDLNTVFGDDYQITQFSADTSDPELVSVFIDTNYHAWLHSLSDKFGECQIQLRADDENSYATTQFHVTITPMNDMPVVQIQSVQISVNNSVEIQLTATDPDADDVLVFEITGGPFHGLLDGINPNFTYHPQTDFVGADTLYYEVSDGTVTVQSHVDILVCAIPVEVTFNLDANNLIYRGLFLEGMSVYVDVFDAYPPQTATLMDSDQDGIFSAQVLLGSPAEVRYCYAIDSGMAGTTASSGWIRESGGQGTGRVLVLEGSSNINLAPATFDNHQGLPIPEYPAGRVTKFIPQGSIVNVSGTSDDVVTLINILPVQVNENLLVSMTRVFGGPVGDMPPEIATLCESNWWEIHWIPGSPVEMKASFSYSSITGINDPGALRLLSRAQASDPWTVVNTVLTPYSSKLTVDLTSSDVQFALASVTESNTFMVIPPGQAGNPQPADSSINVSTTPVLSWSPPEYAQTYDIYLWSDGSPIPSTPIVSASSAIRYQISTPLLLGVTYNWRVDSRNLNNVTEGAIWQFTVLNHPDLQVTQVNNPSTVYSGSSFETSWTVANMGLGDTVTPVWYDKLYLSPSAQWEPSTALLLGTYSNISYLTPEDDYDNAATVTMPLSCIGSYYVYVVTDYTNGVIETFEGNNITRSQIAISAVYPPTPDLVANTLNAPSFAYSGSAISVSWSASNNGLADIGTVNWSDSFYLSQDTVFDPTDVCIGSSPAYGPLAISESYSNNCLVTLPPAIYGEYYVILKTDSNNQIHEYLHEGNNTITSDTLVVFLSPPPDLVVDSIVIPESVNMNESIQVSWRVTNSGVGPTVENSWTDRIFASADPVFSLSNAQAVGDFVHTGDLIQEASYQNSATIIIPDVYQNLSTPLYIYVYTDCANQVFEHSSEGNNFASASTTLLYPDLQPVSIVTDRLAQAGGSLRVTWNSRNNGPGAVINDTWLDAVYLTQQPGSEDTYIRVGQYSNSQNLSTNQTYTKTANVPVPNTIGGSWYVIVKVDDANSIYEKENENNNVIISEPVIVKTPDLAVTNIALSRYNSGETVPLAYTVTNLGEGNLINSSWADRIYLSEDIVLQTDIDIRLDSISRSGSVYSDQNYTISRTVNLPEGIQGDYYFIVITDAFDEVFESLSETNNIGHSALVSVGLSPSPDLVINSISSMDNAAVGDTITVTWFTGNQGASTTTGTLWKDKIYLSQSPNWNPDEATLLESKTQVHTLIPGAPLESTVSVIIPSGFPGQAYLFAVADAEDDIYEYQAEDNNVSQPLAIVIQPIPLADLCINSFNSDNSAFTGQSLSFSASIGNIGSRITTSNNWYDRVYLSVDQILSPSNDTQLFSQRHTGVLNPGNTYQVNSQVTIPNGLSGTFYLFFCADADHTNQDENWSNNADYQGVAVTLTPPPDLIVSTLNWTETPFAGQPLTVSITVSNVGTGPTLTNWYNAIYLSSDQIINSADILLATRQSAQQLIVGETETQQIPITLPQNYNGNYYLIAKADYNDNVFEMLNDNNTITSTINITLLASCDLVVQNIQNPSIAHPGDSFEVTWTLLNQSENPALGWMREGVYISRDNSWDIEDVMIGYIDHYINIPAYGSDNGRAAVNPAKSYRMDDRGEIEDDLPGVPPGEYYILVRTDLRNNIPETTEYNNISSSLLPTTVEMPEVFNNIPQSFNLPSDGYRYYSYYATAGETVKFILLGNLGNASNELFCSFGEVPTRSNHTFSSLQFNSPTPDLTIPTTRSGYYYLLIYSASGTALQHVQLTASSLLFGISNIQPNQGGNTGEVTVKISGARFFGNISASLYNPITQDTLRAVKQYYWDGATHFATFNLKNIPQGIYDVIVQADSITTRLESGFQIVTGSMPVLASTISHPSSVRNNSPYPVNMRIQLCNNGNNDIPIQDILLLNRFQAPTSMNPASFEDYDQVYTVKLAEEIFGLPVLRPGAFANIDLYAQASSDLEYSLYPINVILELDTNVQIDWNYIRSMNLLNLPDERTISEDRYLTWAQNHFGLDTNTMKQEFNRLQNELLANNIELSKEELLEFINLEALDCATDTSQPLDRPLSFTVNDERDYQPPVILAYSNQYDGVVVNGDTIGNITIPDGSNIYVITHGIRQSASAMSDLKNTVRSEDENAIVFVVDWSHSASWAQLHHGVLLLGYKNNTLYAPRIGNEVANILKQNVGFSSDKLCTIGFSLGSIVNAVMISNLYNNQDSDNYHIQVKKRVSLDQAGPIVSTKKFVIDNSLSNLDDIVEYHEAWHASLFLGDIDRLGDVDIYLPPLNSYVNEQANHGNVVERYRIIVDGGGEWANTPTNGIVRVGTLLENYPSNGGGVVFEESTREIWDATIKHKYVLSNLVSGIYNPSFLEINSNINNNWLEYCQNYLQYNIQGFSPWVIQLVMPVDPNEIQPPAGFGDEKWVSNEQQLDYNVLFENDQEFATASAQTVRIEVPIDEDVAPSSFRLGNFGFANMVFQIPANRTYHQQRLDVRDSLGVYVDVIAGIDIIENKMFWIFQTIDPETGVATVNPLAGFLPVNDSLSHRGEGFVTYSVVPMAQAITGSTINAQASIIFDNNQPVITDEVFNTIDADSPISYLNTTANTLGDNQYALTLQASDAEGSGVAYCQLYMQTDNDSFVLIRDRITGDEVTVTLGPLHVYRFFTLAADNTSNLEAMKNTAELTIDLRLPGTVINSGGVSGVWNQNQGPYHILGNIWVEQGNRLIVNSGTEVVFYDSTAFNIYGTLQATRATFKAANSNLWQGLHLHPTSNLSFLQNCTVQGGHKTEGSPRMVSYVNNAITSRTDSQRNLVNPDRNTIVADDTGIVIDNCVSHTITSSIVEGFQTGIRVIGIADTLQRITKNTIKNCFNGIDISTSNPVKIAYNTIYLTDEYLGLNNGASGTALSFDNSSPIISNNTIVGYDNALYAENSDLTVLQNIFWTFNASSVSIGLFNSPAQISYNDIKGSWNGSNNINSDPEFVSVSTEDFRLVPGSPCIDSGDPTGFMDSDGSIPDIGSHFYAHKASFRVLNSFPNLNQPVSFRNTSLGHLLPQTSYSWDFNSDGIPDSYERDPVYAYSVAGDYSVTLIIVTDGLRDSVTVSDAVIARSRLLKKPTSVQVEVDGENTVLTWSPVSQYIDDSPAIVAGYLVYRGNDLDGVFYSVGLATTPTFTDIGACGNYSKAFYVVIAHDGQERELVEFMRLNPSITIKPSKPAFEKPCLKDDGIPLRAKP